MFQPAIQIRRALRVAAVLLAMLLPAMPAAEAGAATLTIGVGRDFYNGPEGQVYVHGSTNTWEALTRLDETFTARPWLAESWHTPDQGRTWVFRLRRGVLFHDGSPLTAERAATALNRLLGHPGYDPNHLFKLVESISARGELDLVYRLKAPIPFFPKVVSYYGSPIVQPDTVSPDGRMEGLVGTGPFRLGEIKPGQSLEVLAFDRYWGGRPAFDRVVFRTILDANSRLMALQAGQIDAIVDFGGVLPQQLPDLRAMPGMVVKRRELGNTHQIVFNCRKAPFAHRAWRLWLAGQLDRGQLVEAYAPGAGVVAHDPHTRLAPEWAFGCVAEAPAAPAPGPADASRELVILLHNGFAGRLPYLEIAQVVQQVLAGAGFRAAIRIAEPGAYRQARRQGRYDLVVGPSGFLAGDPDYHYSNFVEPDAPYAGGWDNAEARRLIAEGRGCADQARRLEIYRRLCELVADNLPMLPLYHDVAIYVHSDRVADLEMDVIFRPWLDKASPVEAR